MCELRGLQACNAFLSSAAAAWMRRACILTRTRSRERSGGAAVGAPRRCSSTNELGSQSGDRISVAMSCSMVQHERSSSSAHTRAGGLVSRWPPRGDTQRVRAPGAGRPCARSGSRTRDSGRRDPHACRSGGTGRTCPAGGAWR
eukprot:scaffold39207_cov72-Phaeocystis_antarctica.AAC.2